MISLSRTIVNMSSSQVSSSKIFNRIGPWIFILFSVIGYSQATWTPSPPANWKIKDPTTNETCFLLSGDFTLTIPYYQADGTAAIASVTVPQDALTSGDCAKLKRFVKLSWSIVQQNNMQLENSIVFQFKENGTGISPVFPGYSLLVAIKATVHANPTEFPQAAKSNQIFSLSSSNLLRWAAPLQLSFYCDSKEIFPMSTEGSYLTVSHLQVQAFHDASSMGIEATVFPKRSYCSMDIESMMINGLLFIILLFIVSIAIVVFVQCRRRISYRPI